MEITGFLGDHMEDECPDKAIGLTVGFARVKNKTFVVFNH